MLIVLDDARDAAQVRPLLPGTGSCAVIVTSRHRLSDLAGSRLIDLDVLDDAEAAELFTRIIGAERAEAEPEAVRDVLAHLRGPAAGHQDRGRAAGRPPRLEHQDARQTAWPTSAAGLTSSPRATWPCGPASRSASTPCPRLQPAGAGPGARIPDARRLAGAVDRAARRRRRSSASPRPGRPTPWRYWSTRTCWSRRPRTGTGCTTCCGPTRPSGPQADEPAQAIEDAVRRVLGWYLQHGGRGGERGRAAYRGPGAAGPAGAGLRSRWRSPPRSRRWPGSSRSAANLVAATRQAAAQGLHDIAWKLPVAAMVCFDRARIPRRMADHTPDRPGQRAGARRPAAVRPWVLNNLGMVLGEQRADDAVGYFEQALAIYMSVGDRREPGQGREQPGVQLPVPRAVRGGGRGAARRARTAAPGRPAVRRGRGAVQPRRGVPGTRAAR